MSQKLYKLLKRILAAFIMLYSYNLLVPSGAIIPINIVTISALTIFKIPGLLILITIRILIY